MYHIFIIHSRKFNQLVKDSFFILAGKFQKRIYSYINHNIYDENYHLSSRIENQQRCLLLPHHFKGWVKEVVLEMENN